MSKNKIDKRRLITKIIAGFFAGVMVLSTAATLIYYLVVA